MSKRHNDHQKIDEVLASFVENNKLVYIMKKAMGEIPAQAPDGGQCESDRSTCTTDRSVLFELLFVIDSAIRFCMRGDGAVSAEEVLQKREKARSTDERGNHHARG